MALEDGLELATIDLGVDLLVDLLQPSPQIEDGELHQPDLVLDALEPPGAEDSTSDLGEQAINVVVVVSPAIPTCSVGQATGSAGINVYGRGLRVRKDEPHVER